MWWIFNSYIGKLDAITISVWNHRKIHKKEGGGFLGCVRIMSNAIQRLKDTGCNDHWYTIRFYPNIKTGFPIQINGWTWWKLIQPTLTRSKVRLWYLYYRENNTILRIVIWTTQLPRWSKLLLMPWVMWPCLQEWLFLQSKWHLPTLTLLSYLLVCIHSISMIIPGKLRKQKNVVMISTDCLRHLKCDQILMQMNTSSVLQYI